MAHAILSPSSAHRWLYCPASPAACKGLPEESSAYAEEGTQAHRLAELTVREDAAVKAEPLTDAEAAELAALRQFAAPEMVDGAEVYRETISGIRAEHPEASILLEHSVCIEGVTGESGACGTIDCVVMDDDDLFIVDFKYGRGIRVEVEQNLQLMIYALGILTTVPEFMQPLRVTLVIVQPRNGGVSRWSVSTVDLLKACEQIKSVGSTALSLYWGKTELTDDYFGPSEEACRFCRCKATCKALAEKVKAEMVAGFVDLDAADAPLAQEIKSIPVPHDAETFARAFKYLDLIEDWCKATRAAAVKWMEEGGQMPGYKLVAGRQGPRKWSNPAEVERAMKIARMRQDEIYERKLVSPTSFEKLVKAGEKAGKPLMGKRQIELVRSFIVREDGKPTVVPDSDERPALAVEEFKAIEEQ